MKPKKRHTFILTFLIGHIILASCTKSVTGDDREKIEEPTDYATQVTIEPALVRTFVGAEMAFQAHLTIPALDSILNVEWKNNTPRIATVDSVGHATIHDLGAAKIIAIVTDTAGNYVASDTARLYSEAKMTFETTDGYLKDLTEPGPGRDIFVGGTGPIPMFRSADQGETWQPVSTLPSGMFIQKIHQAPSDPGNIMAYLAEPNTTGMANRKSDLYESADNGKTWSRLTHPEKADPEEEWLYRMIDDVVYSSHSLQTRYATVDFQGSGVSIWRMYSSEDAGLTWDTLRTWSWSTNNSEILTDTGDPQRLYIGRWGTGYYTHDGGSSWHLLGSLDRLLAIDTGGSLYGYFYPDGNNTSIMMKGSIDGIQNWKHYYQSGNAVFHMDTYESEVLAVLELNDTNAGHYLNMSLDRGGTWDKFYLSFNDRRTFLRPYMVEVLERTPNHIDMLLIWGHPDLLDRESQIWRLRWYYNLESDQ